jgi:hypothetical protein
MNTKTTSIVAIISILSIMIVTNMDSITKTSDEKYVIKKWESTYINSTGQKAKDNKIELSNNYWEGGKFSF